MGTQVKTAGDRALSALGFVVIAIFAVAGMAGGCDPRPAATGTHGAAGARPTPQETDPTREVCRLAAGDGTPRAVSLAARAGHVDVVVTARAHAYGRTGGAVEHRELLRACEPWRR